METLPTPSMRCYELMILPQQTATLSLMTREVDVMWNDCCAISERIWQEQHRLVTAADLWEGTEQFRLRPTYILSATHRAIVASFALLCAKNQTHILSGRTSKNAEGEGNASGWVPFEAGVMTYRGELFFYGELPLNFRDDLDFEGCTIGPGEIREVEPYDWRMKVFVSTDQPVGTWSEKMAQKRKAEYKRQREVEAEQHRLQLHNRLSKMSQEGQEIARRVGTIGGKRKQDQRSTGPQSATYARLQQLPHAEALGRLCETAPSEGTVAKLEDVEDQLLEAGGDAGAPLAVAQQRLRGMESRQSPLAPTGIHGDTGRFSPMERWLANLESSNPDATS